MNLYFIASLVQIVSLRIQTNKHEKHSHKVVTKEKLYVYIGFRQEALRTKVADVVLSTPLSILKI